MQLLAEMQMWLDIMDGAPAEMLRGILLLDSNGDMQFHMMAHITAAQVVLTQVVPAALLPQVPQERHHVERAPPGEDIWRHRRAVGRPAAPPQATAACGLLRSRRRSSDYAG